MSLMDADFARYIVAGAEAGLKSIIVTAFIAGVCVVLLVGGVIWGGIYIYNNYSIVKTPTIEQTTNVQTNGIGN